MVLLRHISIALTAAVAALGSALFIALNYFYKRRVWSPHAAYCTITERITLPARDPQLQGCKCFRPRSQNVLRSIIIIGAARERVGSRGFLDLGELNMVGGQDHRRLEEKLLKGSGD
ncbi:hypothetical protein GOODEAATRI_017792 [Goodea atripinnis]|uniref:Uncharacterized protein n=1 Tax=Goodea atripinnis TaxID=208336 RepID=A0ABV0P5T1_9TELE